MTGKLNKYRLQNNYPLLDIDEIHKQLGSQRYFTAFHLMSGFDKIPMSLVKDKVKTADTTHAGHWQFIHMPMGLKNSPATFHRLMNVKLQRFIGKICFV